MAADTIYPLRSALDAADPKPDAHGTRADKKNYAQRLSNSLAQLVADALRGHYPEITPTATGGGQEAAVAVDQGYKRLHVKVNDPALGLTLCVSIKTYSFPDYSGKTNRPGRWTKNVRRNDHELRGEARRYQGGEHRGAIRFFDVEKAPPRSGPPSESATIDFDGLVDVIKDEVDRRNRFVPIFAELEGDGR